jgi:hypothetical protein
MTSHKFCRILTDLWGDDWRTELPKLLKRHGHEPSRMTIWRWRAPRGTVPEPVAVILRRACKP